MKSSQPKKSLNKPESRAREILIGLKSGQPQQRNEAILTLARCDAKTRALVEREVEERVKCYSGPDDDLSDWHTLDSEPFHFPEESSDF